MTPTETAQLLQGLGVLIAAVASVGAWVSNCVLSKRNGRKIDATHESIKRGAGP